jgi:beta-galactosidase
VPNAMSIIEIPSIKLNKVADVLGYSSLIKPVLGDNPMTFEELNQGYGYVLYSRHFKHPISGTLAINGLRDYAVIYIDGEKVGELNRNTQTYEMEINIPFNATLQILVENMGRINYGSEIVHNTKGIISPITIAGQEIKGEWEMYQLPMNEMPDFAKLGSRNVLKNGSSQANRLKDCPVFYEGSFILDEIGDTFIDMEGWGKGIVFINGHNIGRYWQVGPQQTLYIPGVWLKKGENKIVIFEQLNENPMMEIKTVKTPVLKNLK